MRWAGAYLAAWFGTIGSFAAWCGEISTDAQKWRRTLTREAQSEWGISAPISDFGAQIHQESAWKPNAKSKAGAVGISQFMPSTAEWITGVYPELGPKAEPANPIWGIRAMVRYDRFLWDRVTAADDCHRFAKTLSSFNGGLSWIASDERLAASKGLDPARWFGNVETVNSGRSAANFRENRQYPSRILVNLSPRYQWADWGPTSCSDF